MFLRMLIVMTFSLVGLLGCASKPQEIKPKGTVAITLTKEKKVNAVAVKLEHLLVITLPPTDPAFVWELVFHDTRYLKQLSDFKSSGVDGEGSSISFFTSVPGKTKLKFLLTPVGNARETRPVDQQDLTVQIQ